MSISWRSINGRLEFESHGVKAVVVGATALLSSYGEKPQDYEFCNIGNALAYAEGYIFEKIPGLSRR